MDRTTRTRRARGLRRRQTYAEAVLWQAFRARRLDGLHFRRQHPIDPWCVDFACLSLRLVIELDGGVHGRDERQLDDYHRQKGIEALGWCVLRFPNAQVTGALHTVIAAIREQVRIARGVAPHPPTDCVGGPLPLPTGEGPRRRHIPKPRLPLFRP
ncbi:endonuclease domain-containing protein [Brevundimonas sp. FT23042]|uniref:endonuclease domain-containing protein n=1 Tax=Brevundimonas sp. FT23042 TaxID=3393749 RepID=UPI003B588B74